MANATEDRETTLQRSYGGDWNIYSCVPRDVARLKKLAARYKRPVKQIHPGGIRVTLPSVAIKIGGKMKDPTVAEAKPRKPRGPMSLEHKAKLLAGLARARAAKKEKTA